MIFCQLECTWHWFSDRLTYKGQFIIRGGRPGANMGRAIVFHASTKGRVKQFGACHKGVAIIFYAKLLGSRSQSRIPL